ncbi:MAG: glycosyltransferase family 4 protein [Kiritimatiellae bacterium]|nr:glycosyltransferase family 4 protein [Kiritimatiellia bacterium]
MRIGFVWTGFTSYMADCWRELASRPGVALKIWIEEQRKSDTAFDVKNVMRGLDFGWDYSDQITDIELRIAESEIKAFSPDILFICGWSRELPPFTAKSEALRNVPKILCCDMPWEWKPRKFAARFVLWRHLRRFKKIMVPGVRAARYARWLGFKREDIILGEYGIDVTRFAHESGQSSNRKGFVFVGRLVKAKGIRTLAAAYSRYRELVTGNGEPWNLDVYGVGPEKKWLDGIEGVSTHGFAQPDDIAMTFCKAGAFVITSHWDPWPLVMLESCAAGLPIVCTDRCWNRYELVKGNGIVVKSGDVEEMAKAMVRVAHGECNGECGQILSLPYSCPKWTERIIKHCKEIVR